MVLNGLYFERLISEAENLRCEAEHYIEKSREFHPCLSLEEKGNNVSDAQGAYRQLRTVVARMTTMLATDDASVTKERAIIRRKYDQASQKIQMNIVRLCSELSIKEMPKNGRFQQSASSGISSGPQSGRTACSDSAVSGNWSTDSCAETESDKPSLSERLNMPSSRFAEDVEFERPASVDYLANLSRDLRNSYVSTNRVSSSAIAVPPSSCSPYRRIETECTPPSDCVPCHESAESGGLMSGASHTTVVAQPVTHCACTGPNYRNENSSQSSKGSHITLTGRRTNEASLHTQKKDGVVIDLAEALRVATAFDEAFMRCQSSNEVARSTNHSARSLSKSLSVSAHCDDTTRLLVTCSTAGETEDSCERASYRSVLLILSFRKLLIGGSVIILISVGILLFLFFEGVLF